MCQLGEGLRGWIGRCADLLGWKAMPFALEDLDSNLLQKLMLAWILVSLKKHCVMVCYLCEHVW